MDDFEDFENGEAVPDWHMVGMGDWKEAEYPDKLETLGLSTCLGIGVLNRKARKGYLGHVLTGDREAMELLQNAVQTAESPADLEVVFAGYASLPPEDEMSLHRESEITEEERISGFAIHETEKNRYKQELLDFIAKAGITNVRDEVSERPASTQESYDMIVDTEAGTIVVTLDNDPILPGTNTPHAE